MANLTNIAGTDQISNSRSVINNNFSELNTKKIETSVISTDNTLGGATPSDSKLSTEKAVKEYADSLVSPTGKSWNEYAVSSNGTDSYAITIPGLSAYVAGMTFKFKADVANTGACTLNVNGLGAKSIKKEVSSDLVTNDILAGKIVTLMYDGTNMQVVSVVPSQFPTSTPITCSAGQETISWSRTSFPSFSTTIPHTLGVIPKLIRLTAVFTNGNRPNIGMAGLTYVNGINYGYTSVAIGSGSTDSAFTSNNMVIRSGTNAQMATLTGTITTLNSTNIIITFTLSGDTSNLWFDNQTATITWEAIK